MRKIAILNVLPFLLISVVSAAVNPDADALAEGARFAYNTLQSNIV